MVNKPLVPYGVFGNEESFLLWVATNFGGAESERASLEIKTRLEEGRDFNAVKFAKSLLSNRRIGFFRRLWRRLKFAL